MVTVFITSNGHLTVAPPGTLGHSFTTSFRADSMVTGFIPYNGHLSTPRYSLASPLSEQTLNDYCFHSA